MVRPVQVAAPFSTRAISRSPTMYSQTIAADLYGGAIYNSGGKLSVSNSTFSGNSAAFGLGGAIDNSGSLTVADSTFTGGAAWQGGAIDNKSGGVLSVTNSTFTDNSGTEGGAIFNNAHRVDLRIDDRQ